MPARGHRRGASLLCLAASLILVLAGCSSASPEEKRAEADVAEVGRTLGMTDRSAVNSAAIIQPTLAALRPDSPPEDFVRFAVYHHPAVRAAYFDWKASVHAIAPARALPDPQLTFQADIADTLMSLMPGLMFEVMAPGKRTAMAHEATAMSETAYRAYVSEVVRVAGAARRAWIELAYSDDTNRLFRQTIHAAEQAVALAGIDYTTGRGMANFDQQVKFQNILAQHHSHHAAVAERITAARAKFKSALGLLPTDADPAWPDATLSVSSLPPLDELWTRVVSSNPDLARMRTMVEAATASVLVARSSRRPNFTVGAMVDLKAQPLMVRPTATVTLPVWKEKIRATIAAAEARRDAAAARVTAEELNMAAQLAQMTYMVREADSMLVYMNLTALPNLDRSLASAEAASQSGMGSPIMIAEVQLMKIEMLHERLDVLRDRETAIVDLTIMLNGVTPPGAPLVATSEHRVPGTE